MFQRKLIMLVPIVFLNACVLHQSPAPGCSIVIGPSGCFGRTIITDLVVTPKSQCLTVDVDNCNGGVVDVRNQCNEIFRVGDLKLPPGKYADMTLDLIENEKGELSFIDTHGGGNFSDYQPKEDKRTSFNGLLGSEKINISFTKTAPLCE